VVAEPDAHGSAQLLWTLDGSLAGLTGPEFFLKLAQSLAGTLDARCAFVCEFTEGNTRAEPLVFWYGDQALQAPAYALEGTPCERVLTGDIVVFERKVAEQFPHHRAELEEVGAESYLAIPMKSRDGQIMGHVAVIDIRERTWAEADFGALRICATRATAELEHQRAQRTLAAVAQELEQRVRERTQELEAARADLELRVEERTASLSALNTRLRHEIAARTEAEAAQKRQEEAYRDLYDNAPNVYWSTGADGLIKRVNRRAAELFGIEPEELIGKPYTYLIADTPAGLPRGYKVFQRFLEGKPTYGEEFEFRGANGRVIWASVNVLPIFDENGKPVATRTTLADITERKRAEEALQHRVDLEQLMTEVATSFVGARPDDLERAFERALARLGVWGRWDRARVFLHSAGRAQAELHYEWHADGVAAAPPVPLVARKHLRKRDELLDVRDVDAAVAAPFAPALTAAGVGGLIVVPVANSSAWLGALELVTFGRAHSWQRADVQLLRLLGEIMASTLERCAAERELEQARQGAEAASRAKSEFLARMSHELRTPLNAILGYAQLLQRDTTLGAQQRQQVETVHRSGEHLLTLINEVLDLARVEAGRVEIELVELDLRALVRDVESMFRSRAEAAGLTFRAELGEPWPERVRADDRRLRQILINLLGNAVKFTPRGGEVTLRVEAERWAGDDWRLTFTVRDTGIGIAPADLERIFEPFYQVGPSSAEGLGLGLAITRRLAEAMDGELTVASREGKGTAFTLGLTTAGSKGAAGGQRAAAATVTGYRGARRRILIADDVAENRALLASLLRPLGFDVTEAADGDAALDAVQAEAPDLLLLDLVMPGLDGFEVVQRLRAAHGPAPRVVAVSANAFDEARQRALAMGCDSFMTKPVDVEQLLAVIAEQLELDWLCESARAPEEMAPAAAVDAAAPPLAQLLELRASARTGDVLAVGTQLDALAAGFPAFTAELRGYTARFDLRSVERALAALIDNPGKTS
jgi:PAS domain S-box-containing protein